MKYAFIERHRRVWPISVQCRVLGVSVAGYHEHFVRRASDDHRRHLSDDALLVHIKAIHAQSRGSDYCYRFLDYICEGSFDKAYEMLADSIKAPETEKEREERLKEEEKAKEENRKIWRQVFGLDKAGSPSPAPSGTPLAFR